MENQRNKEIIVGVVTFVAIALLFIGITLGKGFQVTSEDQLLKIRFPNSGGLQVSEPVVVNGVKRGTIVSVKNDKGTVLVTVHLDNYNDIRPDAKAKITLLEITGGKKIEIHPGVQSGKFSLSNEMIGSTPPDIAELVTLVGEVSGDATTLVRRLDTIAASGTQLLADGQVVKDLKVTTQNAAELSSNLNKFVDNNYSKLENTLNNLNSLTINLRNAVDKHEPTVGRILQDIELTLKDARKLVGNIDSAVYDANELVSNINSITSEIKNGKGFVNKLIYDKELNSKLDSTFTNLTDLIFMIKNYGVNVNVRLGSRP
jgi:phospholipid/cholesterol/gamma-HCH transport system substrate-binding protein